MISEKIRYFFHEPPLRGVWFPTIHVSMFRCHSWWYIFSCGQRSLCCSHPIFNRFNGAFYCFKPNSCCSTRWHTTCQGECNVRRWMLQCWGGPEGFMGICRGCHGLIWDRFHTNWTLQTMWFSTKNGNLRGPQTQVPLYGLKFWTPMEPHPDSLKGVEKNTN